MVHGPVRVGQQKRSGRLPPPLAVREQAYFCCLEKGRVFVLMLSVIGVAGSPTAGRELDQEIYRLLSHGMTEPEVAGRAGEPDRRINQLDPTPLSRRITSYQDIWNGDTSTREWTTARTFSSNTNKVIRIERDRW